MGICSRRISFPLRFPLAFDGKLLGQVVRLFTDSVSSWYRKRHKARGLPDGDTGAVTVIQRANSDLRLSPHFHTLFLDGAFSADIDGKGRTFHPGPAPSQDEVEAFAWKVSKRILRFLEPRGVITLVTAPGDGEVTVVTDETMAEKDPLLAELLAAAMSGTEAATRRREIRIVMDPDERPVGKGTLCGQSHGFNLQSATRVAPNDKDGRERLCRHILRPPLAKWNQCQPGRRRCSWTIPTITRPCDAMTGEWTWIRSRSFCNLMCHSRSRRIAPSWRSLSFLHFASRMVSAFSGLITTP
jgi:hypothetical protein